MRRYLQPSAVNDPVSAWGLYKSDDDQTHSDDLCCALCCFGGRRGRNLARAGAAGLSGASWPRLFDRAGALSAGRLIIAAVPAGPISMGWTMKTGRTRRVRRRCRRPARCFRRMIRATAGRWALRRSIPTALCRPVRSFRPTIRVMAVPPDRRRMTYSDPRHGVPAATTVLAGRRRHGAAAGSVQPPSVGPDGRRPWCCPRCRR